MKIKTSFYFIIHSVLFFFLLIGCGNNNSSESEDLTDESKQQIELEIRQRVDTYFEDVQSKDIGEILSFWSDSEQFIHAGDGRIFGNYEKWSTWLKDGHENGDVKRWLFWRNSNVHVVVLSKNAGAYTMNFENSFIDKEGKTQYVSGSWTYVMRKSDSAWRVVMSNGTHNGFSYDD